LHVHADRTDDDLGLVREEDVMRSAAAMIVLAGCYSPSVRDCVLACSSDADCAAGQSCSGGLCAASGVSCGDPQDPIDSAIVSPPPADAIHTATDARVEPDAPAITLVAIVIAIVGMGSVTIGATTCTAGCTVQVPTNQSVGIVAVGKGEDVFGAWTSAACHGQAASCSFTPTAATLVAVVFVKKLGK
jgi:hypothetical protein